MPCCAKRLYRAAPPHAHGLRTAHGAPTPYRVVDLTEDPCVESPSANAPLVGGPTAERTSSRTIGWTQRYGTRESSVWLLRRPHRLNAGWSVARRG